MVRSIAGDAERALRDVPCDHAWWRGPRLVLVFAPIAGVFTGSAGILARDGVSGEHAAQMVYSAIKLPMLVLLTAGVCLPAFYVFHLALGVRRDFRAALSGVLGGQGLFAVVLCAMGPMLGLWYTAAGSRAQAVLGAAAVYTIASIASLVATRRVVRQSVSVRRTHRFLLGAWLVLYALVGIQMGWMLRPFVGSPGQEAALFRGDALTNGYVVVFRLVFGGA